MRARTVACAVALWALLPAALAEAQLFNFNNFNNNQGVNVEGEGNVFGGRGSTITVANTTPGTPETVGIEVNTAGVLLGTWEFSGNNGNSEVAQIVFNAGGSGSPMDDTANVTLWDDTNGDGSLDSGEPMLGILSSFAADRTATFDLSPPALVSPTDSLHVIVTADVTSTPVPGRVLMLSLESAVAHAPGNTSQGRNVQGVPAASERTLTWTTGAVARLTVRSLVTQQVAVAPGAEHEVIGSLRFEGSGLPVDLTSLTISGSGDGHEAVHVMRVAAIRDINRNGKVDGLGMPGGDSIIDDGTYLADNGSLTLSLGAQRLSAGSSLEILIAYTLAATAPDGAIFELTLSGVTSTATEQLGGSAIGGQLVIDASLGNEPEPEPGPGPSAGAGPGPDPLNPNLLGSGSGCNAAGSGHSTAVLVLITLLIAAVVRRSCVMDLSLTAPVHPGA